MTCLRRLDQIARRIEPLEARVVINTVYDPSDGDNELGRRELGLSRLATRGVVAEGAVGTRAAGRLRLFRYEIRRWRDGVIPDVAEAVDSPQRLSDDAGRARRLLELVPQVPTPVWGRDELQTGEMWNSNSLISWLIRRTDLDIDAVRLPDGGRAPGWHAGIVVANRRQARADPTAAAGTG